MKTKPAPSFEETAAQIERVLAQYGVKLTMGGEPTYVPLEPEGSEWHITALGPTKLGYGYALADALVAEFLPQATAILSPGKTYPGELNPRWVINLVWRTDGAPLHPRTATLQPGKHTPAVLKAFRSELLPALRVKGTWLRGRDPFIPERQVWILPLDHNGKRFASNDWRIGRNVELLRAEGSAGLRLPLDVIAEGLSKRALVLEVIGQRVHVFLPPLLQVPFTKLLETIESVCAKTGCEAPLFDGYLPPDDAGHWTKLGIASDPGVLEINLPPCATWQEYDRWMHTLEKAGAACGLRSFKQVLPDEQAGTGGGNHLLFGGPTLEENALFTHPAWVTSILRYWQHHPSLAYLFTGHYVGSSSQAPRPDESRTSLYDLEMAYAFLEKLPAGDHRQIISETIRHLHTDASGNTHRSEISFDKFWNVHFDGGCRGLIEFRAVESLPHARWMSTLGLLWKALAAFLLAKPFTARLIDQGDRLHDAYFLPIFLWADFSSVLADLRRAGFVLPEAVFQEIVDWRFPVMLRHGSAGAALTVRKAHEGWPLLSETPLEGGSTSRFVDTSIERLEFVADADFANQFEIRVQGRRLLLETFPGGKLGSGLRYRRTALYPSLHPGVETHMPLVVEIIEGRSRSTYLLDGERREFRLGDVSPPPRKGRPCQKLRPTLVTCDLRLP